MNLDLRLPVGLLFLALGTIMIVVGLASGPAIYMRSLGIDVNLWWGIVELLFGGILTIFSLRRSPRA